MAKLTFGKWLNEWLKVYKKPYVKSWKNIEIIIRLHIPQRLKDMQLKDLSSLEIQKAINNIKKSRTAIDVFDVYRGSLSMAFNLDLISKDITRVLIKPKHVRKVGKRLEVQELIDFLEKIKGERLENYYKFVIFTGCRRSEALRVKWSDVDFKHSAIHIPGTKTATSDRYLPLFPELLDVIKNIPHKSEYLFTHRPDFVSHKIHEYTKHTLKDLRHTFGSICYDCGVDMKILQKYMGHARLQTTSEIYVHPLDGYARLEGEKVKFLPFGSNDTKN